MYLDLGLAWDARRSPSMIDLALHHGFVGVAETVTMNASQLGQKVQCPITLGRQPVVSSHQGVLQRRFADLGLGLAQEPLLILRRLNLLVHDSVQVASANRASESGLGYDFIVMRPMSEEAFQFVCEQGECDLISLPMDIAMPFVLRQFLVNRFLQRGGFFEIEFAPMVRDTARRRQLLTNVAHLLHATKGKGVVLSSGAADNMEMRSPADLVNFAAVLGLRGERARKSLSTNPLRVLQKAALRRGGPLHAISASLRESHKAFADIEMKDG
uniref:Uncharacterized protein n=1 Tax=Noctiluca scintillans TaxID=2966 RepID=A0A7S1F673_NOCSC|mmetsp:Transcript_37631/g.100092  ORF Transcript_37631/g.100092 Transcript_37631/m.100092 type:complete len:271 (+) Transcript_37631:62-874(+)